MDSVSAEPRATGPVVYFEKSPTTRAHAGMCLCLLEIPLSVLTVVLQVAPKHGKGVSFFPVLEKGFLGKRRRSRTRNVNSVADLIPRLGPYCEDKGNRISPRRGLTPSAEGASAGL